MNVIQKLGLEIQIKDCIVVNDLPMYISNTFCIESANINGVECIMLTPIDDLPSTPSLSKQMERIIDKAKLPVFLNLDQLSIFRRDNLLTNNIPFIFKEQLIYLPFIGTVLTNTKVNTISKKTKFSQSTQMLFLWIMYKNADKYYIGDAVQELPYSNMSLTRAYRQLVQSKLFEEHKEGRKIYLTTIYAKNDLFKKASEYFVSPIVKVGYINKDNIIPEMMESGETALSKYTLINPPTVSVYAADKKHKLRMELEDEFIDPNIQCKVELWDYNPSIFSKDEKSIDLLSLMIAFKDNEDERIETAIDELLAQLWEEI